MNDEKERKDKYWICDNCAKKKKWTCTDSAITVIHGLCGWCKREDVTMLIPLVDFNGPGKKAVRD